MSYTLFVGRHIEEKGGSSNVESPSAEAEQARRLMEETMTNAVEYPLVPLEVEFQD